MARIKWTRLLAAGGIAIVVIGGVIAVDVLAHRDHEPAAAEPRFGDTYGRVLVTRAEANRFVSSGTELPRMVGPAEIRIGGKNVSVPRGTPFYGGGCSFFTAEGLYRRGGMSPCYAQAGLRADGHTARWIFVFNTDTQLGPKKERVHRVRWSGRVVAVRGDNIVFADGVVVPGADARVSCGLDDSVRAADLERLPDLLGSENGWGVTVDAATGRAESLGCIGRA